MNEELEPFYSENKQTIGELFLQFLGYYSSFNYEQHAISIRMASVIPIANCRLVPSPKNDPHQWKELCIEGKQCLSLNLWFFFAHFYIFFLAYRTI